MTKAEMYKKIVEQTEWTFRTLDREDLIGKVDILWNNRFERRLGDARVSGTGVMTEYRMRFSAKLWPKMTEAQRRTTVIHEACHIVVLDGYRNRPNPHDKTPQPKPHGIEWQNAMRKCGEKGEATSKDVKTGKTSRKPYRVKCNCDEPRYVSKKVAQKIHHLGQHYRCRVCKVRLELDLKLGELPPEPPNLAHVKLPKSFKERLALGNVKNR